MMIDIVLLLSLFIAFAYVVKGVSGFGEGMVFITLSLLFLDIKFILPIAAVLMLAADLYMIYHTRRDINRRAFYIMAVPVIIGVMAGAYMLSVLDSAILETALGIFIILFAIKMLFFDNGRTARRIRKSLGTVAGFFGGLLDGLLGTGGPPIVMYLSYSGLTKAAFRATCIMTFFVYHIFRILGYSYFNILTTETVQIGLLLIPGMILGSIIGMKIHPKLNERMFRKLIAVMLLVIGIALIY
jgi:uncharacterized membrane protein YfcA